MSKDIDKLVNTIICGDCLEVMKDWPGGCVDLVLTDPPYPTWYVEDYKYDEKTVNAILSRDEKIISFWTPMVNFPVIYDSCHCWDKVVGTNTQFELIYMLGIKEGCRILRGFMTPHSSVRAQICGDISTGHKSQKPLRLLLYLTENYSQPGDLILDPFCGSGTTCVAAKMLGRRYIGIDISEDYCEIARQRLRAVDTGVPVAEQRKGQLALFEGKDGK
jgi:site-specific DNA-methyltransferase (adenine-specific)